MTQELATFAEARRAAHERHSFGSWPSEQLLVCVSSWWKRVKERAFRGEETYEDNPIAHAMMDELRRRGLW